MSTKEQISSILNDPDVSDEIKAMGQQILEEEFKGDEVAQKLLALNRLIGGAGAPSTISEAVSINENEVKEIVREVIDEDKISESNLDAMLQAKINAKPLNMTINVVQGGQVVKTIPSKIKESDLRPLVQKILSDVEARNNVYLYGGAGTGKTFMASTIREILDWEIIEVSCNQFTSPLELIGGQTIDGYQEGKVIRAFGNLNEDGSKMQKDGCILLLDELPKLDPNTAGILNAALSRIGEFKNGMPASIQNGRGEIIPRGNVFVIATGNTLLNSASVEYEANFKQDLSLQDRFAGSTYEVFVDTSLEWNVILNQKWAFIFIYLNKLRKAIFDNNFQGKAFVSVRLMQSAQKTYKVFRQVYDSPDGQAMLNVYSDPQTNYTPAFNNDGYYRALSTMQKPMVKTLENTMFEFYNLFTDEQQKKLKEDTMFNDFLDVIKEKNRMPLDSLNTQQELEEVELIIRTSPSN